MSAAPRIVAFLCDHCAYTAADAAGRARAEYPQALLSVRVQCTGRVAPEHVLAALREGADGVLVAGCHPGDCHYLRGNLQAAGRLELLRRTVAELGVDARRVRLEWIGASEIDRFAAVVTEMVGELAALGPLDYARVLAPPAHDDRGEVPVGQSTATLPNRRKPKIALWWNASCGGCDETVVDLAEDLDPILGAVEVVLWPVALDFRRADLEALPDGGVDIAFVNGATRLEEHAEWARLLRRKARTVVAFGACAHTGGIVGLGNLATADELLAVARRADTAATGAAGAPALTKLLPRAFRLSEVVPVDYFIPGCPPTPRLVHEAVVALLSSPRPPAGSVLSPGRALCDVCPRKASRPESLVLGRSTRLDRVQPHPDRCFLADGVVCMGPATRQGCDEACLRVSMPCRGCFGPPDGVVDQGAAMMGALGALAAADPASEADVRAAAAGVVDPVGTFYRYSLAAGTLPAVGPRRP